jgi:predicted porin
VRQNNEDGVYLWGTTANGSGSGDGYLAVREALWYLESKRLGRLSVGRLTNESAVLVQGVDLANIGVIAGGGGDLIGGSFITVANTATDALDIYSSGNRGDLGDYFMDKAAPALRMDGVKYTSPTFGGFVFNASIGERDSQQYGMSLKYAGEFNGVRLAAGIGYERVVDCNHNAILSPAAGNAGALGVNQRQDEDACLGTRGTASAGLRKEFSHFGGALSLSHTATGLFVQGHWLERQAERTDGASVADATNWTIQGGIARNFFGIGQTSLYGEYMSTKNWVENLGWSTAVGDSKGKMWGLGVVQTIDAAAMDLYMGYRNFDTSDDGVKNKEIDILSVGARIKF